MAKTKNTASADIKETAVKTEAASAETTASKKGTAKADEKKPAAKRGRKPAAAKAENTTEKKAAGKPGRKPAAAKAEKKPAGKPGRKPAAAKAEKASAPTASKRGPKKGISYEDVVTAARKKLRAADTTKITRRIAANVELTGNFTENQTPDENGSNKNVFYIALNLLDDGSIEPSVEPYRYNDNDISIYADAEELMTVLNGKKNIYDALADGNIHIHGNTKKAILLIHAGF